MKIAARRVRAAVGVVVIAASLAACGGDSGGTGVATAGGKKGGSSASPSATATKDPQDAMLEFARCMRKNGVDMPDPGEGGAIRVQPGDESLDELKKAHEACKHLAGGGFAEPGDAGKLDPKMQERMLKYAKCMREQGVDMPDPGEHGLLQEKGADGVLDPNSETFKDAHKACGKYFVGVTDAEVSAP